MDDHSRLENEDIFETWFNKGIEIRTLEERNKRTERAFDHEK